MYLKDWVDGHDVLDDRDGIGRLLGQRKRFEIQVIGCIMIGVNCSKMNPRSF
jgi:hypothetical protein